MDVSIVIVSWNVRELLRGCLESVYKHTKDIAFEVFVVDNGSNDDSAAMVAAEFSPVKLIANKDNLGFAAANNQALSKCAGRYVLLLNPDTELIDNAVKKMADFMDGRPDAAGCGCRLVYPDGSLQPSCRHFPSLSIDLFESLYLDQVFPHSTIFNRYRMGCWQHDSTREVDQPYGACLLLRHSALRSVGLMDERFFMYYDEIDLCYRIKKSGGKIYYTNTITIIHHSSQSSKQLVTACEHYKNRSRIQFFAKHYGTLSVYILTLNLILRTALVWLVFGLSHMVIRRPRDLEYFKGSIRIMWSEIASYLKKKK